MSFLTKIDTLVLVLDQSLTPPINRQLTVPAQVVTLASVVRTPSQSESTSSLNQYCISQLRSLSVEGRALCLGASNQEKDGLTKLGGLKNKFSLIKGEIISLQKQYSYRLVSEKSMLTQLKNLGDENVKSAYLIIQGFLTKKMVIGKPLDALKTMNDNLIKLCKKQRKFKDKLIKCQNELQSKKQELEKTQIELMALQAELGQDYCHCYNTAEKINQRLTTVIGEIAALTMYR